MNEVVRFPINTPVEVTLQSEAGTHVEGRYGEQVMYSLLGNRVMYVPLYVEQRFQELAIGGGEPLVLCKQAIKNGNRNRTEWSVRRAPQQPSSIRRVCRSVRFSSGARSPKQDWLQDGRCCGQTDATRPSRPPDRRARHRGTASFNGRTLCVAP